MSERLSDASLATLLRSLEQDLEKGMKVPLATPRELRDAFKELYERRVEAVRLQSLVFAARDWRLHGEGQSHCEEEGCRCCNQVLREAIDALEQP
jgi:hypothetical protein